MKTSSSFPRETPDSFPVKAGRGTAFVTIYHKARTKGNATYHEYSIPYSEGGNRRFHTLPNYDKARLKGNEMLDLLAGNEGSAVTLREADKVLYNRALDALGTLPTVVPLDRAVADYVQFRQLLGGDHFKEAISAFLQRKATLKEISTPALVKLFIEQKTSNTKRSRPASP